MLEIDLRQQVVQALLLKTAGMILALEVCLGYHIAVHLESIIGLGGLEFGGPQHCAERARILASYGLVDLKVIANFRPSALLATPSRP